MNKKYIMYFIWVCVITSFNTKLAFALDEHPRKDEFKVIREMCEAPWDNAEYFKKRFPEAFAEATKCKKYMCSGVETPSIDYITDRSGAFDVTLCKSIVIAAKPGGLEEQMRKLDKEGFEAMKAGDRKAANEVISRQRQFKKDNGID
jgi:hypothetical protein